MSADNAYFVYQDKGGWWRVKHGFASSVPELDTKELEEFFADAWGSKDYDEATLYAHRQADKEYICEYGVWPLSEAPEE